MILKIARTDIEYADIKELRNRIFCNELKIQNTNFADPYNDHDSIVFYVENSKQKIASARIVFSKNEDHFYFSYFLISKKFRQKMTGIYLLGGLFYFLRCNRITEVCVHAHSDVIELYRKFGLEQISEPFFKEGFTCYWIKMRYRLGTNKKTEDYTINRVQKDLDENYMKLLFKQNF